MNFSDYQSTQKGTLAERIGRRWLQANGYHVYAPCDLNNPHPIDNFAMHKTRQGAIVFDMKAKPRREKYPDTGIDVRHWQEYRFIARAYSLRVLLIFIDEDEGRVYGNFLDVLDAHRKIHTARGYLCYPRTEHYALGDEIRYFPVASMRHFSDLTQDEVDELRALSGRAAKYETMAQERKRQGKLL